MTPEEIAAIIEDHKFPTLHAGETGINVITLQIWLGMLGFYQGAITGSLDAATAQAVDAFRADQTAKGTQLTTPPDAVLKRDTWEAMDKLLQHRLPPDPTTLERPPFPRRSSYDLEAKYHKALYEGLYAFGFPVKPAQAPIRFPLVINASGVCIVHGIPPGSYTLELGDAGSPGRGSAELQLQDGDGAPVSGQIRLVRDGAAQSATVASGHALVNGLEPGDYQVVVEKVDDANQIIDNTGSLEIRLCDANNRPVSGTATLVGQTGDVASLQQAVRLFQALSRKITSGLEPGDRTRLGNILTGEFAETAHHRHELTWDNFEQTWGRFYGAPWMGVVFHPLDDGETGREQEGLNWGERETVTMLYDWGIAYLLASQDENDLAERLRRPIAIRYIARPQGGRVDGREDFSQIGTEASLHLPRTSEKVIAEVATGQTYGGIDYESPEYSTTHLEAQLAALTSLGTSARTRCPDDGLVDRLLPTELQPFEHRLTSDKHARSRSINCSIGRLWRRVRARLSGDEKSRLYTALTQISFKDGEHLDWISQADFTYYKKAQVEEIIQDPKFAEHVPDKTFPDLCALGFIKKTQKALWWCRLLLSVDRWADVKRLSDQFVSRGYKGLFVEYSKVLDSKFFNEEIAKLTFDDTDWGNPWQLEALAELYVNFNDPWKPPRKEANKEYYELGKNRPRLPGDPDFIELSEKMSKGLHFILVDPIGPRLRGTNTLATGNGTDFELIGVMPSQDFDKEFEKVNNPLDTIHFPDALGHRTYRINRKYNTDPKGKRGHFVELDIRDTELDKSSVIRGPWQVPAGVGGQPPTRYAASSKLRFGYDQYDGALFVMKDGLIRNRYSFTSYTSRANESPPNRMSVRGNISYGFYSLMPGSIPINYGFKVETPANDDARYYFDQQVTQADASGIFIHNGFVTGAGTFSWGCQVSPAFYDLRDLVLDLYPKTAVTELSDKWKNKHTPKGYDNESIYKYRIASWNRIWELLHAKRDAESRALCKEKKFQNDWDYAIQGTLWLIRPDERPLD